MMNWSYGKSRLQRVDHPIAIEPHIARLVLFKAVGVGVARRIQPMPPPALAIVRRGEQPLDLLLIGVGAVVGQKRIHLRDRRRQADQIERQPPQ